MNQAKPLPVAVAALFAMVRRHQLIDAEGLHRLRTRLLRDGVDSLPSLRRWLLTGDVNRRVGQTLVQLLAEEDNQRIGDCLVLAHLTDGGMGSVDLVEHDGQLRVCKTIKAGQHGSHVAKRFRREAEITATFNHPHLVRSFAHGDDGERLYLVLEWVPGGDVQLLVDAVKQLEATDALIILHQAALGLAHAHERHLVHRDIKPANLLVTESGTIRVADFGLARSDSQDSSWMTAAGATVGTPSYMAPEQIRGHEVDGRADLYALGCVLHFCVTGHPPWNGTIADVLHGHLDLNPPVLMSRHAILPPAMVALHRELLAKDPARRPANSAAVAARTADMLRALGRDPEDGLGQHAVVKSTSRHPVIAHPSDQMTEAETATDAVTADPATRRIDRRDALAPDNLANAISAPVLRLHQRDALVAVLVGSDSLTVGRDGVCAPCTDHRVGRQHCRLVLHDDQPAVRDEESANGTWLDDRWLKPQTPHPLAIGCLQRLNLGDAVRLEVRTLPQRTPPAPEAGSASLGSHSGWDGVLVQMANQPPIGWIRRRVTVGPSTADLPLTGWTGAVCEIGRWQDAWVWRQGDTPWQAVIPGQLGATALRANV